MKILKLLVTVLFFSCLSVLYSQELEILEQPINTIVCDGQTSKFWVKVDSSGSSSLEYTWFYSKPDPVNWLEISDNDTINYSKDGDTLIILKSSLFLNNCLFKCIINETESDSADLSVNPLPEIEFTYSNTCFGDSTSFQISSSSINPDSLTYHWDFGDSFFSIIPDPQHYYDIGDTSYVVELTVEDFNSCVNSTSDTIKITKLPDPFIYGDLTFCSGEENALFVTENYEGHEYYWEIPGIVEESGSHSITVDWPTVESPTEFVVSVTEMDTNGCKNLAESKVLLTTNVSPQNLVIQPKQSGSNLFVCLVDSSVTHLLDLYYLWGLIEEDDTTRLLPIIEKNFYLYEEVDFDKYDYFVEVYNNKQNKCNTFILFDENSNKSNEFNSKDSEAIKVYPNPCNEVLNIELEKPGNSSISSFEIYNCQGIRINEFHYSSKNNQHMAKIPVSGLSKGLYVVVVRTTSGEVYSESFIIE
ncbi:MAG: T9SS type A sorting domain-containing protein [Bacteroidales bacterium]|nr:T9SS type A sorting domain-containing protein [Bacteroidales bacterium]